MSVLQLIAGVVCCAVLFVVFAVVRTGSACTGDCGACQGGKCHTDGVKE